MQWGPRASPGFRAGKDEEELNLGGVRKRSGEPSGEGWGQGENSSRRRGKVVKARRRRKGQVVGGRRVVGGLREAWDSFFFSSTCREGRRRLRVV